MTMTTMNDLMNLCQMIKLENRANTKIKFVGEQYILDSDKEKDYMNLDASKIKSIKLVFGSNYDGVRNCYDTLEIEIG
tara:strand:+ start:1841 stop:2074 length:234 start_codon:yes stop_codon:yes gene_type:complete